MPIHVVALEKENDRQHFLTAANDPAQLHQTLPGTTVKAFHALPTHMDALLRPVIGADPETKVSLTAAGFRHAVSDLFAQGRIFADAQAALLPPFASAQGLVHVAEDTLKDRDVVPVDGCDLGQRKLTAELGLLNYHFVTTFERGMQKRITEMGGYPHYFAASSDYTKASDVVTHAARPTKILIDMNRSLSKKKKNLPVTVEPMFIHRLSPRVQELLVFADTLVNMRRDTGTDDDEPISDRYSPTIPFTEARYHAMVREVYAEGRALYENYRDLHPPIAAMPSRPQKKSESTDEQQKSCVFNRIATALDKDGAVELTGMTLRAVVVKLLQTGREQAWKGEE